MRRLLLVFVTVFAGSGCLCGGCGCPPKHGYPHGDDYRRAEQTDRQKKAEPVIDALKRHSIDHGKYPETLDELIASRRLERLPDLESLVDHQGASGRIKEAKSLEYIPNVDRSRFELRIDFTFSEFSMSNPRYVSTYTSDDGKWHTGRGPSTRQPAPTTHKD